MVTCPATVGHGSLLLAPYKSLENTTRASVMAPYAYKA